MGIGNIKATNLVLLALDHRHVHVVRRRTDILQLLVSEYVDGN